MTQYVSSEYNKFGSTGWSAYRGVLDLTKSSTTGNAKTTIKWTIKVQMKYAWGYGVGIQLSGADSGTATGYLTYNPGSSWATVATKSGSVTVTGTTATQSKKFTVKAYGTTVSGYGSAGGSVSFTQSISVPALTSYKVSYNANGGSGAPSTQTKYYGKKITLSSKKPSRAGYTFKGWNTKSTGKGTSYSSGGTYSANASVTLYAVWETITYKVSYSANGGSGAPSAQTKVYGTALTLSSVKPTRNGYSFVEWKDSDGDTYKSGAKYTKNESQTLTAQWKLNSYIVQYNKNSTNASGSISPQSTTVGASISLSDGSGFSWTDHRLIAWNTRADGSGTRYGLSSTITYTSATTVTLYAMWEEVNNYMPPKADITGELINYYGIASNRGKRFQIYYDWSKAIYNNTYQAGTITLQESSDGGENWRTLETKTSNKGASTYTVNSLDNTIYRLVVTDTGSYSGEDKEPSVESTILEIPQRDSSPEGNIPVSISNGLAARENNFSRTVNFSFDWEAYNDGNVIYTDSTVFRVAAVTYTIDNDTGEYNYVRDYDDPIYVDITTSGEDGVAQGKFSGDNGILTGLSADIYILKITSNSPISGDEPIVDIKNPNEMPLGTVTMGGFTVHITPSGMGIGIFDVVSNDFEGLQINGNTTIKSSLEVDDAVNFKKALTVNGLTTFNNNLDVNGQTNLKKGLSVTGGDLLATGYLRLGGRNSGYVGKRVADYSSTAKALTGSPKKLLSITLSPGMWIVHAMMKYSNPSSAGSRRMVITTSNSYTTTHPSNRTYTSQYTGSTLAGSLQSSAIWDFTTATGDTPCNLFAWNMLASSSGTHPDAQYYFLEAVQIR